MKGVAQILRGKPSKTVHAIGPNDTVYDAVKKMAEHGIGGLLVMEGEKILGIITERDYARKIALAGRTSKETPVSVIMTTEVLCVGPQQTTEECMAIMTENRVRHLPVLDKGKLIGLVSIGDLVKDIISEQQFIIEQLEHYIAGDRG
ncbi:MAG: putative signal-transduction protein with domain [Burkholderiaceae bacterium]|jgi:CBS domain-containing protein|nr:putative signal-transduction protein with domain [Burkholderiaceae bacterium]